jgi:hypothetical protein
MKVLEPEYRQGFRYPAARAIYFHCRTGESLPEGFPTHVSEPILEGMKILAKEFVK